MKKYWIVFLLLHLSLVFAACGEKKPEKLVVCTDAGAYEYVDGALRNWKKYRCEDRELEVEIINIPSDETSAEVKVTELRTEIMSGEGPDVFVFANSLPTVWKEERRDVMLFPNPEKAMYSDLFLPMDSYLEESEYIHTVSGNPVVLQAGQTEEGQMLLPIIYDYYACIFPEEESDPTSPFPESWEEIVSSEFMMKALRSQNYQGFMAYLGQLADYQKEELLISEEMMQSQWKEMLSRQSRWRDVAFERVSVSYFLIGQLADGKQNHVFYPVPNVDGGVTAGISVYAGINRNTQIADEAFSFLETFYEYTKNGEFFTDLGIFIEQDEYLQKIYKLNYHISEKDIDAFLEMDAKISVARFYSAWDYLMWDACDAQGGKNAEPAEESIHKLYQRMQMELKE